MDHLKYLGIKFIVVSLGTLSIFSMFDHVPVTNLVVMAALATAISYVVGDLLVLRRFGNLIATISDFFLMAATLWLLSTLFVGVGQQILLPSLFAAYLILFL
ncbi:DUF2512 family protein [Virgibacillus halophilus]|uniref:DUF2512 family protein n=1 Tax=Tigheibacillus halophilus TaxID=361280 RepID=A0ABU5C792_9BACI|nr:DUF2512 family protein [Virgibacillus halophilus]